MNWLHGCWGVGATLGPVIMGVALAHSGAVNVGEPGAGGDWRLGYQVIGALQLSLAVAFLFSLKRWTQAPPVVADGASPAAPHTRHAPTRARHRAVAGPVSLFFVRGD
jgi:MFS family permease